MLSYKGYHGKFEVDFDANIIHGDVIDVQDAITFQARTPDELQSAFEASIDDYLEYCEELGQKPAKPFSGQFLVRSEPELHRCLYVAASSSGKSVNQYVVECLWDAVNKTATIRKLSSKKNPGRNRKSNA